MRRGVPRQLCERGANPPNLKNSAAFWLTAEGIPVGGGSWQCWEHR